MRAPCGGGECFALIRRQPLALTHDVSEFLSPEGASTTHLWNDDGDLVPEPGEAGPLVARHGGAYHEMSETLARPTENQFTFGIRTPKLGPFHGVVAGVGRCLFDRYTVRLSDPSLFSPIETHTAEGQSVTAYAKDLSIWPAARNRSRHCEARAAVIPTARDTDSRSFPRNRRSTTSRFRPTDNRPPRPGPAASPVALRAPSAAADP